jgi:2-polyprenyl-3-methyl-5-hydroxy-6-metoxy-1,4-benzoquinol methylase
VSRTARRTESREDGRHTAAEYSTPKASVYYEGANDHMLGFLPEAATRILDVGCAAGGLGREIKKRRPDAVVHGIEYEPEVAKKAREQLDLVFEMDLNRGVIGLEGPYDCIFCGDVLEHLIDPWSVLRDLVSELRPGGHLIAGFPNVRHYKVIRDLLFRGTFEYRDSGIMDSTHLRFFTLREMEKLLEGAGVTVVARRPRVRGRNALLRFVDKVTAGRLEEFRAVQYTLLGERR